MDQDPRLPHPLQVNQLITICNELLSNVQVQVEGEVANVTFSRDKFVFFDLKDEEKDCMIGIFMMRFHLNFPLEDGMKVVLTGKPTIHSKRGQFRFTASRVDVVGEGSIKRAFELLKKKLEGEGLFDPRRKRPVPRYVHKVGIVSSVDAAGFGDFCRIAWQRLKGVDYVLANVAVQGKDAEREIVAGIDYLNSHDNYDAIVLMRGGGSLEDLHAFNSESVARAIVRSKAPVIVGVGHERDVTIADFCADLRAATPTNAAQLLLPTPEEILNYAFCLTQQGQRMVSSKIIKMREININFVRRIRMRLDQKILSTHDHLDRLINSINALSPKQTLSRGYSILQKNNIQIKSAKEIEIGDNIVAIMIDGKVELEANNIILNND